VNRRPTWFVLVCSLAAVTTHAARFDAPPPPQSGVFSNLPLAFELNRGQTDTRAQFFVRPAGMNLYLTEGGALLSMAPPPLRQQAERPSERLPPWQPQYLPEVEPASEPFDAVRPALALRYAFAQANPHPRIEGIEPLPGRANYFIGNDPKQWRTDIPMYRRVRYYDVYPGIDVVYYGNQGRLEFDIEVAPGADLAQVRLRIEGADGLALKPDGDLDVRTVLGSLVQRRPVVYQLISGKRRELRGDYVLQEEAREVAFNVPDYDRKLALVLDPTLIANFLVGGGGSDNGTAVAADASGNWYLTGYTDSSGGSAFPTTVGAYKTTNQGGTDIFVRKLSSDGLTVAYSTYIGGNGGDQAFGIGVDSAGIAYLTGNTNSSNFPTLGTPPPLQANNPAGAGGLSGFVTALNAAGSALVYSTYLGGSVSTFTSGAIAVDAAGNAYVTGYTGANDLPTTPDAFEPQTPASASLLNSSSYVFKFAPDGTRIFGTYLIDDLGDYAKDKAQKIAIDDQGNAYVTGTTAASFTTYNGVIPTQVGPGPGSGFASEILVARLNHTGRWLDWVTHLGGGGLDAAAAIAVNAGHQVMIGGWSQSDDLPPATPHSGANWGWIGQLDETGTQLLDSIWIGAAGVDAFINDLVWDGPYVTAVGEMQNPGALPASNAITSIDCGTGNTCGAATDYGGFIATFDPLTPTSLTRITGGTPGAGSPDTRLKAIAQAPNSATGRVATALTTNGTTPGATGKAYGKDAGSLVIDTLNGVVRPPVVQKYFDPPIAEPGQIVNLVIDIGNPNPATALTNVQFNDILPDCLTGSINFPNYSFYVEYQIHTYFANLGTLNPGASVRIEVPVESSAEGFCENQIDGVYSNEGSGGPAKALFWTHDFDSFTFAGPGSSMNTGSNYIGGKAVTNGADITSGVSMINDLPVNQAINFLKLTGNNATVGGGAMNILGGINNSGANNTVSTGLKFFLVPFVTNIGGTLNLTGPIDILGGELGFAGSGTTNVSGTISGQADVRVFSGYNYFDASPTSAGEIHLYGGTTFMNAVIHEKTFLDGDATLRGGGPWDSITVNAGTFYPGIGTTPASVDVGDLTLISKAALDFSANNSTHSAINTSGTVLLDGMTLKLNFGIAPPINATFSGLINSSGGHITGCPANVVGAQPNLVLMPLCTTQSISAKVTGNDRVFFGSFDFNPLP